MRDVFNFIDIKGIEGNPFITRFKTRSDLICMTEVI